MACGDSERVGAGPGFGAESRAAAPAVFAFLHRGPSMAAPSDRFSSQNMMDCGFCSVRDDTRRFRTQRQCSGCGKPLCLVCRAHVPRAPFLCPDCGGGPPDDALRNPGGVRQRLEAAGFSPPYWLLVVEERIELVTEDELAIAG